MYLFTHERRRQREKQTPHGEPNAGPYPGTPGSHPGPRADAPPLIPQSPAFWVSEHSASPCPRRGASRGCAGVRALCCRRYRPCCHLRPHLPGPACPAAATTAANHPGHPSARSRQEATEPSQRVVTLCVRQGSRPSGSLPGMCTHFLSCDTVMPPAQPASLSQPLQNTLGDARSRGEAVCLHL